MIEREFPSIIFYDLNKISEAKQKGTKSSKNGDRMRRIEGDPSDYQRVVNLNYIKDESVKRRRKI
jgi:predicted nucleic acid-binding Zn finger protein